MNKKKKHTSSNQSPVWTTYDLGVASALLCKGYTLLSLDKGNPRKVLFAFEQCKGIDEDANAYFAAKLKVDARTFFDSCKALKSRIYSA